MGGRSDQRRASSRLRASGRCSAGAPPLRLVGHSRAFSVAFLGEVAAWEQQRNAERPAITWHLTTVQAPQKLSHAYPIPA